MIKPLTHEPLDEFDREVLAELRAMHEQLDPPPGDLAERVKFALTLAALEAEVAELQELSLAEVRSEQVYATTDSMTFTSSTLSLMVTVTPDTTDFERLRVDGWVTGPGIVVELSIGTQRLTATSDANGRLVWEGVPRGRARFLIHPTSEGARPVVTPTIEL
jgi:hypothetical protein